MGKYVSQIKEQLDMDVCLDGAWFMPLFKKSAAMISGNETINSVVKKSKRQENTNRRSLVRLSLVVKPFFLGFISTRF